MCFVFGVCSDLGGRGAESLCHCVCKCVCGGCRGGVQGVGKKGSASSCTRGQQEGEGGYLRWWGAVRNRVLVKGGMCLAQFPDAPW